MASSMPVRHLLVMVLRVWRGVMMSRSHWGWRSNTCNTLSSISRCWAVTQQMDSIPSRPASSLTRGAILIASGLVPKTLMIRSFSTLFLLFRRGVRGRFCQSFLMLVVVVGVAGNAGHGIGRANQRRYG